MVSAVDNGSSTQWRKIRERILRRDSYCCQQCGQDQGKLHVDHIIPLASANTETELIGLCHFRNLQPLWAADNLAKGCKIL